MQDRDCSSTFSFYDHVLDTAVAVGAIPDRFRGLGLSDLDTYFAMAREVDAEPALELTKWFDTNYHYLVPEISPETIFAADPARPLQEYAEARELGIITRPVLVGPATFLLLAKGGNPFARLDELVAVYAGVLRQLAKAGVAWVQLRPAHRPGHHPGLVFVRTDQPLADTADHVALAPRDDEVVGSLRRAAPCAGRVFAEARRALISGVTPRAPNPPLFVPSSRWSGPSNRASPTLSPGRRARSIKAGLWCSAECRTVFGSFKHCHPADEDGRFPDYGALEPAVVAAASTAMLAFHPPRIRAEEHLARVAEIPADEVAIRAIDIHDGAEDNAMYRRPSNQATFMPRHRASGENPPS